MNCALVSEIVPRTADGGEAANLLVSAIKKEDPLVHVDLAAKMREVSLDNFSLIRFSQVGQLSMS